jgi:hypothetical protein
MQKEALVHYGPSGTVWRLVSDEGPYLNGTDLAPFPLAFYTTGMALSFTEELLKQAKAAGLNLKQVQLTQDNFYTMEGSALRGDMIGGALPVKMQVEIGADAAPDTICRIVELAEQSSPAQVYMREVLTNTFALGHNGVATPVTNVTPSPDEPSLRFHIPLIEPDMQIYRIRLSDKTSRLRPRLAATTCSQTHEPKMPVQMREWIRPASASSDLVLIPQPPA